MTTGPKTLFLNCGPTVTFRLGLLTTLFCLCLVPAVALGADPTPSPIPSRIALNPTLHPEGSQTVTWRTDAATTSGKAEIKPVAGGVVKTVTAIDKGPVTLTGWTYSSRHHTATFTGLRPATGYLYRVGSDADWSDWIEFRTAGKDLTRPWQLLYFGDAQIELDTLWPQVVDRAFTTVPDADATIFAGDMVDRGADDVQWGDWFAGLGDHARRINQIPVVGNHELEGDTSLLQYGSHFTNTGNGPAGADMYHPNEPRKTVSFTDYQGVRIISLDGNDLFPERQLAFLEAALKTNPNRWTVVAIHQPFISNEPNGAAAYFKREDFMPVLRKYNVDLVLQGHNHSYARGFLESSKRADGSQGGPVFLTAVSGSKRTPTSEGPPDGWSANGATRVKNLTYTGTFQRIDFSSDRIQFRTHIAYKGSGSDASGELGDLADSFTIIKPATGKKSVREGIINASPAAGRMKILRITRNRRKGSATAKVRLPSAGLLKVTGRALTRGPGLSRVTRRTTERKTVTIPLRTKRSIAKGRLKVRVAFVFNPGSGRNQKIHRNFTLIRR